MRCWVRYGTPDETLFSRSIYSVNTHAVEYVLCNRRVFLYIVQMKWILFNCNCWVLLIKGGVVGCIVGLFERSALNFLSGWSSLLYTLMMATVCVDDCLSFFLCKLATYSSYSRASIQNGIFFFTFLLNYGNSRQSVKLNSEFQIYEQYLYVSVNLYTVYGNILILLGPGSARNGTTVYEYIC